MKREGLNILPKLPCQRVAILSIPTSSLRKANKFWISWATILAYPGALELIHQHQPACLIKCDTPGAHYTLHLLLSSLIEPATAIPVLDVAGQVKIGGVKAVRRVVLESAARRNGIVDERKADVAEEGDGG